MSKSEQETEGKGKVGMKNKGRQNKRLIGEKIGAEELAKNDKENEMRSVGTGKGE